MTSTIVRVKRRLEESPLEALVLHCKRARTEHETDLKPSVFVFSGTVKEKDHSTHFKKTWMKNYYQLLENTKSIPELLTKLREEHKDSVQNNRFKILNYSRDLSFPGEDVQASDEEGSKPFSVLDLHHAEGTTGPADAEKKEEYAYDLYLSNQKDFHVEMLDDIVRIDPYQGELVFGTYRDNGRKTPSDDEMDAEDDEDSNEENNWKNEYPDTDDSVQEEDMKIAMKNFSLEDDLSSDAGEEDIVYGNSSCKTKSSYHNVNPEDVDRYGLSYALYKAKLFKSKNLNIDGEPSLIDCQDPEDGSDDEKGSDSIEENDEYCDNDKDSDDEGVD